MLKTDSRFSITKKICSKIGLKKSFIKLMQNYPLYKIRRILYVYQI